MFDFVRKETLWNAWDEGWHKEIGGGQYHLKTAQDLAVYKFLRSLSGQKIAEIGGGNSRLLKRLSLRNECSNVEKFEGVDGGPESEIIIDRVTNIKAFLGEFSPEIKGDHFDVVFSVSVIEHVPNEEISSFFEDGLRMLKSGGLWLHAIDVYISDEPATQHIARFEAYRNWIKDSRIVPAGAVYTGPLKFSTSMASNPDQTMYNWGKITPSLAKMRQTSQSVSLLIAGRKQ